MNPTYNTGYSREGRTWASHCESVICSTRIKLMGGPFFLVREDMSLKEDHGWALSFENISCLQIHTYF